MWCPMASVAIGSFLGGPIFVEERVDEVGGVQRAPLSLPINTHPHPRNQIVSLIIPYINFWISRFHILS
ncbi:hypothetical protein L1987_34845 [Smallanthus sonchifolius]|uniref:Uncharacterized protein n=1 Tax=Smallanthus sonchifolius TaxID=185202 RepID=A0ACB9HW70_9ASTR|nr:hypothetical protein L1987_34845 [Smallanthus sonchifolius]